MQLTILMNLWCQKAVAQLQLFKFISLPINAVLWTAQLAGRPQETKTKQQASPLLPPGLHRRRMPLGSCCTGVPSLLIVFGAEAEADAAGANELLPHLHVTAVAAAVGAADVDVLALLVLLAELGLSRRGVAKERLPATPGRVLAALIKEVDVEHGAVEDAGLGPALDGGVGVLLAVAGAARAEGR